MAFFQKIIGSPEERKLKSWQPVIDKINSLEHTFELLSDEELKAKTAEFKLRLAGKDGKPFDKAQGKLESLDDILPEAFAVVREASKRTLGQRHFDVQLLGGIAMHHGSIAEMRTGEGKTLVATLPLYLNALTERGVHLVTVNDYLARRDTAWMGQIYNFLGLSVSVLNSGQSFMYDESYTSDSEEKQKLDQERDELGSFKVVHELLRPISKQEAYKADITYGTNNEFGFDYLRDNLLYNSKDLSQRDYHFVVVDEIDSILIDEARTPLIISAQTGAAGDMYVEFARIADKLKEEEPARPDGSGHSGGDFTIDEKLHTISLTDEGINKAEKLLGIDNIYTEGGIKYVHHLETAVRAKALYERDKQYVVKDDEVIIVDEFTGRLQPGRRWSEGLHQAVEAKEGVRIKEESRTFASITYQNYFRMYEKLSGMTGTAASSKEEFYKVYGLETYIIPTNMPIARVDHGDQIFQTEAGKMKAIASKVKELNEKGQPVLIGTISIEQNELLSAHLESEGLKHEILNAKNHEREGEITAQAGRKGAITIATNMAGRGVDIKLGGNPTNEENYGGVKSLGGFFVLGTERHDARRIDNQLRGRAGRQGDPGETQFFVSLEDSLMRIFAVDTIKKLMGRFNIPEDEPIENKMITNSLEKAQEKIEGLNFDARKRVLEYDDVLNYQRSIIYGRRRSVLVGESKDLKEHLEEMKELLEPEKAIKFVEKIEELFRDNGPDVAVLEALRRVILQTLDMFWVDHLEMMEYLRGSVNLRAYGQRDPLIEYKREGLGYFRDMEASTAQQIAEFVVALDPEALLQVKSTPVEEGAKRVADTTRESVSKSDKVGRNDPCPCGSGKKYKKCHGANN